MHLGDVDRSAHDAVVWACDAQPGFPMAAWTADRLAQISDRIA
ncbi:hypothetical protein [Mycobacterium colombiense]|nr:hypothetical protein [Mycobacterium colombiense]